VPAARKSTESPKAAEIRKLQDFNSKKGGHVNRGRIILLIDREAKGRNTNNRRTSDPCTLRKKNSRRGLKERFQVKGPHAHQLGNDFTRRPEPDLENPGSARDFGWLSGV